MSKLPYSENDRPYSLKIDIEEKRASIELVACLIQMVMPAILSIMTLGAALFVLLSRTPFAEAVQQWAIGIVACIFGYWLRGNVK